MSRLRFTNHFVLLAEQEVGRAASHPLCFAGTSRSVSTFSRMALCEHLRRQIFIALQESSYQQTEKAQSLWSFLYTHFGRNSFPLGWRSRPLLRSLSRDRIGAAGPLS